MDAVVAHLPPSDRFEIASQLASEVRRRFRVMDAADRVGKVCSKCEERRALNEFNADTGRPDGLSKWCRLCKAAAHQRRRASRRSSASA